MRPLYRYQRSAQLGSYSPFNFSINCKNIGDAPTFAHEYCHHLQNVTTVRGAERILNFLQVAAWASRVCKNCDMVPAPLCRAFDAGEPQVKNDFQEAVTQAAKHWDFFLYWEQPFSYSNLDIQKMNSELLPILSVPKCQLLLLEAEVTFGDNGTVPILLREAEATFGYPLGGHSISEGGAISLERILRNQQNVEYPFTESTYCYDLLPYLFDDILRFENSNALSQVASDFSLSLGPPGVSLVLFITDILELDRNASVSEILAQHEYSSTQHLGIFASAADSVLNAISEYRNKAADQSQEIQQFLEWLENTYSSAFEKRKNDPSYFVRACLNAGRDFSNLIALAEEYSPGVIRFDDSEVMFTKDEVYDHHRLTRGLFNILEWWIYNAHNTKDGRYGLFDIDVEVVPLSDGAQFQLESVVMDGKVSDESYAIDVLGMNDVTFCLT